MVLGVDIGASSIKVGVVDTDNGDVVAESSFATPQHGASVVAHELADRVRELRSAYPEITGLGVGVPGSMSADRSLVRYPPNLSGWKEEPLQRYLQEELPELHRIEVDNDANVAGLAEAHFGAGKALTHFLLVTLGTGVGGAIYATEGGFTGIMRGASGGAGEFGHTSIDLNGPQCNCGSRGCIEAYLGIHYLTERARRTLAESPEIKSTLREHIDGLSPRLIAAAMNDGDAFARSVYEDAGRHLGVALASVANLLDVHSFIIGGGIAEAGDVLFESARAMLRSRVLENLKPLVEIRKARFGNRAGMIGAAMLTVA